MFQAYQTNCDFDKQYRAFESEWNFGPDREQEETENGLPYDQYYYFYDQYYYFYEEDEC